MADVDIVIVNYRSLDHTRDCVAAAQDVATGDDVAITVTVVNNEDDPKQFKAALDHQGLVNIIEPGRNLGFGAACNLGAQKGRAPAILFLNPDTTLRPGSLKNLSLALNQAELAAPALLNSEHQLSASCSRTPTAVDLILRTVGLHRLFRGLDYPYLPLPAHETSGAVDQAMGAALMIRRMVFDSLGGFDERFFVYYEDVDLCARAQAEGFALWYVREAEAVHLGQGSSSKDRSAAIALHMRSRLAYTRKHFGLAWQGLLAAAILLIELPLRFLAALVGAGRSDPAGVLRSARLLFRSPAP